MKPITFENLRRLMGGGRKKKDRGESSFKRSDSFKRISIKRNYLERGGRSRIPHPPAGAKGRPSPSASPTPCVAAPPPVVTPPATPPDPVVIGYGQWIRCQLRPKQPSCSSDERPPTPPPRRRGSSIATDASLEIIRLDRSPVVVRRRPHATAASPDGADKDKEADAASSRPDSAISVNLGRVWLDAPMALAMAPRSLELPRPAPQAAPLAPQPGGGAGGAGRRAHHSLDSALKESRRFLTPRALSSHARDSRISSSKDSGFSFSISIPRLADVSPASLSPPPGAHGSGSDGAGGFFRRRKKLSKPAPSVSRDGYFKRTSSAAGTAVDGVPDAAPSVRRSSSRRKKAGPGAVVASAGRGSVRGSTRGSTRGSGRRKKTATPAASVASGTVRSDIYQVVVGRAPRSLNALKLDPMIFVAPEKRKPAASAAAAASRRQRYEPQEIRGAFVPRECPPPPRHATDTEEDEGMYVSPRSAGSLRASSVESLDRLDSLDEAETTTTTTTTIIATPVAVKEAVVSEAPRRPSVTIKTKRNHVTRVMINMPSEGSSSEDADEDDEGLDEGDEELYAPPGFSPVPRCRNVHGAGAGAAARKPVQRRKSARRNVKYLAKPNIHRAPSTLRRARKCEYAALQRRLVAALDSTTTTTHAAHDEDSDGEWI